MRRFIFTVLDRKQKKRAVIIFIFSTVVAFLEATGIGAIMPFVSMIQSPEVFTASKIWYYFSIVFGPKSTQDMTVILGTIILLIYMTKNLLASIQIWIQQNFTQEFYTIISTRLLKGYMFKPYMFFVNANSAILVKNVTTETKLIAEQVIEPLLLISSEVLVLVAILTVLLMSTPLISMVIICIVILLFGGIYLLSRRISVRLGEVRERTFGQMSKTCSEAFNGIKDIKVAGVEHYFIDKYNLFCTKQAKATAVHSTINQLPRLIIETVLVVSLLGSIIFFIGRGINSVEIISVLSVYLAAAFRIMPSINRILAASMRLKYLEAGFKIIAPTIYEVVSKETDMSNKYVPIDFRNSISIENLSFKYESSETYIINKLNLKINKGEVVGLVGESGVGKSTLINIILGLLSPQNGSLFVDNKSIVSLEKIKSWQSMIAYVPQNVFIADDTLANNIAFGIPDKDINMALINCVVNQVQLKELVEELPEGLNTIVGERGTRLSGGQVQRIGLARALYRNCPFLILDEATSALDIETEAKIIQALRINHQDKTILMVAHRYKSLQHCNKIYRLKEGNIAECLSYEELEKKALFNNIQLDYMGENN